MDALELGTKVRPCIGVPAAIVVQPADFIFGQGPLVQEGLVHRAVQIVGIVAAPQIQIVAAIKNTSGERYGIARPIIHRDPEIGTIVASAHEIPSTQNR